MTKLSWKPVRRGSIYCAPACGRGCTKDEYADAWQHGAALAARLGSAWTVRVSHGNFGWHYAAVSPCGRLKVIGGHVYTAFLSKRGDVGGHLFAGQATT